jgi:hypothetical protein
MKGDCREDITLWGEDKEKDKEEARKRILRLI